MTTTTKNETAKNSRDAQNSRDAYLNGFEDGKAKAKPANRTKIGPIVAASFDEPIKNLSERKAILVPKTLVDKMGPNQTVLLVNLPEEKAFYALSAQEARKAIQLIDRSRIGKNPPTLDEQIFMRDLWEKGLVTRPQLLEFLGLEDGLLKQAEEVLKLAEEMAKEMAKEIVNQNQKTAQTAQKTPWKESQAQEVAERADHWAELDRIAAFFEGSRILEWNGTREDSFRPTIKSANLIDWPFVASQDISQEPLNLSIASFLDAVSRFEARHQGMLAEVIVVPPQLWHTLRRWGAGVIKESSMEEYRNYHLLGRYFGRGSLIFTSERLDKDRILFIDVNTPEIGPIVDSTLFAPTEPDSNKEAWRRSLEKSETDLKQAVQAVQAVNQGALANTQTPAQAQAQANKVEDQAQSPIPKPNLCLGRRDRGGQ